ncbi:MAG: DNA repair protein RadA [Elusimicrobiota bacterium]|nr:DNA repair protein RadA [Elusimicrobiota bacterium]
MFVCKECGFQSPGRQGKCPYCGEWDTFSEIADDAVKDSGKRSDYRPSMKISEVASSKEERISSGIKEIDRVLGGGIVKGSVLLLAGAPGIGKSTLLLQTAAAVKKVLYITGEESLAQIKIRSERIAKGGDVKLLATRDIGEAMHEASRLKPDVVILDSVQAFKNSTSAAASPSAIKEVTSLIVEYAKTTNTAFILSGHITKEGILQGPKIIEHMVDGVFYLEESPVHGYRLLYSTKNRFGNTNELAVFHMTGRGLETVEDPSAFFLSGRCNAPGSVAVCSYQGSSPFIAEIQALINISSFQYPRRQVTGLELNRAYLIIAILERYLGLKLSTCDVFLNVAGGIRISEPGSDLAAAAAIVSSYRKKIMPKDLVFTGEIGLGGEVRGVSRLEERIKKAENLGFKTMAVPSGGAVYRGKKIKVIEVGHIRQLGELLAKN